MAGCAGIGNMAGCAGIGNMAGCAGIGNMAGCAGGWMAGCAGGLSTRQRLPGHALIAGRVCRCHGVKPEHSRIHAVCRVCSGWHI